MKTPTTRELLTDLRSMVMSMRSSVMQLCSAPVNLGFALNRLTAQVDKCMESMSPGGLAAPQNSPEPDVRPPMPKPPDPPLPVLVPPMPIFAPSEPQPVAEWGPPDRGERGRGQLVMPPPGAVRHG